MSIVIVEDEQALRESMVDGLRHAFPNLSVEGTDCAEEAQKLLLRYLPRLLISDIRLPGQSGIDFVFQVKRHYPGVHCALMSAFPLADDQHSNVQAQSVRILRKPFPLKELISLAKATFTLQSFSGQLSNIDISDLLQMLNLSRKTTGLRVVAAGKQGELWFVDGEIVHAQVGNEVGEKALFELLLLSAGEFNNYPIERDAAPQTIRLPLGHLLIEAMRQRDETSVRKAHEERRPTDSKDTAQNKLLHAIQGMEGFIAGALVDAKKNKSVAHIGAFSAEHKHAKKSQQLVWKLKSTLLDKLQLTDGFEDILITVPLHYHLLRPMNKNASLLVHVVLDRNVSSVPLARRQLKSLMSEFKSTPITRQPANDQVLQCE